MLFSEKLKSAPLGNTHLFSLGQAGYIVKSKNGQTLGIDLYLSECVESIEGHDGYHRLMPRIVEPNELGLNVVVATHFHRDHFDVDAIPGLMSNGMTHLFCAYDCQEDVERLHLEKCRVTFVKPGDYYKYGDFDIHFINSDHGEGAPLAVGMLLSVDGKNILEVGDTSLHLDWKDKYLGAGPVDVLIAPINGKYGNLNEIECSQLSNCITPETTIPCHFGMFSSHGGDPGVFIDQMRKINQSYKIMTLGEGWTIG